MEKANDADQKPEKEPSREQRPLRNLPTLVVACGCLDRGVRTRDGLVARAGGNVRAASRVRSCVRAADESAGRGSKCRGR